MGEAQKAPPSAEAIERGLREIRAWRRRYNLVSALGVPAFVVLGLLWSTLGPTPRWLQYAAWLALGVGWLGWSSRLERRVIAAECPRCGGVYHARSWRGLQLRGIFLRSCQHCGLRLRPARPGDRDV
jgi:hypothetical protein